MCFISVAAGGNCGVLGVEGWSRPMITNLPERSAALRAFCPVIGEVQGIPCGKRMPGSLVILKGTASDQSLVGVLGSEKVL